MYRKHCKQLACRVTRTSLQAAYFKTLLVFLLLLVNYTKAKVDFVGLLEVGLHAHDLGKRFFGMLQRAIAIIKNSTTVPKFWFLVKTLASRSFANLR